MRAEDFIGELPPPQYATVGAAIAAALPALLPPRRMDVPTWAETTPRQLRTPTYSGPWRNDFAPYMVEPSRMVNSRRYGAVVFVGPARTVKSDSLVLNTIGHRVDCMPRDVLVVAPTKDAARELSKTKLDPFIRQNDVIAARLVRDADNIFDKRFAGNMRVRCGWPVIGQLSMVDIPDVILTDYDRFPDDVDGEGSAFDLGRKRTQTFGSLGMCIAESSPGRPITDEEWAPASPHEMPPATGIVGLYNSGTRGRWYWSCPQCDEAFEPVMERLSWETRDTPAESAKTVVVGCPHCGFPIRPELKSSLNRAGFWRHETAAGELVPIDDAEVRDTDVVSYAMEGPAAAMQSLQQLVLRQLDAEAEFQRTGDETRLKSTVNLDQGRPYLPRIREVGEGLHEEALKALAKPWPLGIAPEWTRFVLVSVDVQASRFAVAVDAFGPGLERYLVERFDIATPSAGEGRAIDPARHGEDWAALDALLERAVPVVNAAARLVPRALIVDSGGAPGVTANAYAWWRRMRRQGLAHRAFLAKGAGGIDRDRAAYVAPEKVEGSRQKRRTDLRLVRMGTDPLKDEIVGALTRKEPGPGAHHISDRLDPALIAEFCAEVRTPKGWEKRRHGIRNESLDLAVMGKALAIVLKAEKIDWDNPPDWAREPANNAYRVETGTSEPAAATPSRVRGRRMLSRGI